MSIVLTDDTYYQDIANAIRNKNGTTTQYKPSEMAAAINAISTGGGDIGLSNINSSITYPLHVITGLDANSNPIYDSSLDVSGYRMYFVSTTILNEDGSESTSYSNYPTISNGTNTITYDSSNFDISARFYRSYDYKRKGTHQRTTEIKFIIGGDYATEHSSTSYNIFSIKLYGMTANHINTSSIQPIILSYITRLQEKFVNNYTPPTYKYYISYNSTIGRSILHIYDHYNMRSISTTYNTAVIIPTITELYSS